MKKLLALLALVVSFVMFTPTTVEAREGYSSSSRRVAYYCRTCRGPVYKARVLKRDRRGHRYYSWRTLPHSHRYYKSSRYSKSSGNHYHGRSHYKGRSYNSRNRR